MDTEGQYRPTESTFLKMQLWHDANLTAMKTACKEKVMNWKLRPMVVLKRMH